MPSTLEPGSTLTPGPVFRLALFFGLATGLLEIIIRGVQYGALGQLIRMSPQMTWMAPLADVAIFLVLATIAGVAARAGLPIRLRPVLGVFLFTAAIGPILFIPRLHTIAKVLLTAGAASVASGILAASPGRVRRWERRLLPIVVALLVIANLAVPVRIRIREYRAATRTVQATDGAPNVVLIVWDTVRRQGLHLYGGARPNTPFLDSLATGGMVFDRAFSTAPWTLPTHASIMTGYYHHQLSTDWTTALDNRYPTLAEVLGQRGYGTGGFVANYLYTTRDTGLNRGFDHYEDFPVTFRNILRTSFLARRVAGTIVEARDFRALLVRKFAPTVRREFLQWLDRQPAERPVFAFLNYMDAHGPFVPPPPFDTLFGPATGRRTPSDSGPWTPGQLAAERLAYEASIAVLDDDLRQLLRGLDTRGRLDNTILIVVGDHGELFGEHGINAVSHGSSLYVQETLVPLIILGPGVAEGRRIAEPVTLADLPATILALTGTPNPGLPGSNLADLWTDAANGRPRAAISQVNYHRLLRPDLPVGKGSMVSVATGRFHLIRRGDGVEELYDLDADLTERHDLIETVPRDTLDYVRGILDGVLAQTR